MIDKEQIEKVRELVISKLHQKLSDIQKYGTDFFEYHVFYSDGRSYSFSNYRAYFELLLKNQLEYWQGASQYFSQEMGSYYRNRRLIHYMVRVEEASSNSYLKQMSSISFSNGISMYEFLPSKVRYFFSVQG